MLPYSAPSINEDDIAAVNAVLRSGWLTTGPEIERFEAAFCEYTGAKYAVAVSSGTAALHAAMFSLGIGPGDEVIVPALTFVATANAVVYQGGTPVFADVNAQTLLINPGSVDRLITNDTKAIVAMDYAGQPARYTALYNVASDSPIVGDCCHSLGSRWHGVSAGTHAGISCFSLHAIKAITSGEGGVVTTNNPYQAEAMREFRNHGRRHGFMNELGYNYRMTDFQAALARSQLCRLAQFVIRRQEIAALYDEAFADVHVTPLTTRSTVDHARHLYVVRARSERERDAIRVALQAEKIETAVHYPPVHLQPYYRKTFGTKLGDFPVAEKAATEILSLPIFPDMKDDDVGRVIEIVKRAGK